MAKDDIEDDDWEEIDDDDDDDWDDDDEPKKKKAQKAKKPKEQITVGKGVLKLGLIVGGSAIVSVLITAVVAFAVTELPELRRALGLRQSGYNNMLFIVFLLSFLLTVGTSAFAFLSNADLSFAPKNTAAKQAARFVASEQQAWKKTMAPSAAEQRARAQRAKEAAQRAREMEDGLDEIDLDDVDEAEETPTKSNAKLSAEGEQQKAAVMTFLSKGLETVMKTKPKLDAFNKFGVNLFLAGACDAAGSTAGIDDGETAQILQEGVEVLGTSRDQAQKFARSYDSYLLNPKHLSMIEAGRDAMGEHIRGGAGAAQKLDHALKDWNTKDEDEQTSNGTIAVMFTDIAGSTAMTQEHGDAGAQ